MTTLTDLRAQGYRPLPELPGVLLDLRRDAGGERWHLEGRPLHAGDRLDLLTATTCWCPVCRGEGWDYDGPRDADGEATRCSACDGHGQLYRPAWLVVRFEYATPGLALLYLELPGLLPQERHAIQVQVGDLVRCRRSDWTPEWRV